MQIAWNMTTAGDGFLDGFRYLLHDRDTKFTAGFDAILRSVGVEPVRLPARSPNLNSHCERWIGSIKTEVLSRFIPFGDGSLRHVLQQYVEHFHTERNHQGLGNVILFPRPDDRIGAISGTIQTRERFGGLLNHYYRETA